MDLSESAMGGYSESLSSDLEGLLPMKCNAPPSLSFFTPPGGGLALSTSPCLGLPSFFPGCVRAKYGMNALTEKEWNSSGRLEPFLFQGIFFRHAPPTSRSHYNLI